MNIIKVLLLSLISLRSYKLHSMIAIEEYNAYTQEHLNSINKEIDPNKDLMYLQNVVTQLITLKTDNQEINNQQDLKKIDSPSTITIVNKEQENEIEEIENIFINVQDTILQDVNMLDLDIDESSNQSYTINEISITENQNSIEDYDKNKNFFLPKKDSIEYTSLQINKINLYKQIYPEIGFLFSNDNQLLAPCKEHILEEMIIFILLNQETSSKNITNINTNHYIIKTVVLFIAVFNSIGILTIGNNNKINAGILISTQYLTPLYISYMYDIINNISYKTKKGYKHIIKKIVENKIQFSAIFIKLTISLYLAYLASTIDIRLSGDGYMWMASHFTSNNKHLNIAYYLGYFNKLILSIVIYSTFFYWLIEDVMYKTSIAYLLGLAPPPIKNKDIFIKKKHIKRLACIIDTENRAISSQRVSNYLKKYNLNDPFTITEIQNIIINNYNDNKIYNLLYNICSLMLVGTISMFCSLSFKQVFSSKIMLNNFIMLTENNVNKTLHFKLKDGETFVCKNIENCINNIDFKNIYVRQDQLKAILELEKEVAIASILSGISISYSAAITIIYFTSIIYKIPKDTLLKKAIKNTYFRKSNILPYLFCCSILPPFYFYTKHMASSYPIVEKNNSLLQNIGEKIILSATQSITITTICMHIVASRYIPILANIPRLIKCLVCKK